MKSGLIIYYDGCASKRWRVAAQLSCVILSLAIGLAAPNDYFLVRVTDEATGRGVPLIELKLPNERFRLDDLRLKEAQKP